VILLFQTDFLRVEVWKKAISKNSVIARKKKEEDNTCSV